MTKMATMPIYDKSPLKIFSKTSRLLTFERYTASGLGPYKICLNDDPWLTLTYFRARSTFLPSAFVWESAEILDFIETIEVYELNAGTSS